MESWGVPVFLGNAPGWYAVVQGSPTPPGQVPPRDGVLGAVVLCAFAWWPGTAAGGLCAPCWRQAVAGAARQQLHRGDARHEGLLWDWRCLTWRAS